MKERMISPEITNPLQKSCEIKGWRKRSLWQSAKQSACRLLKYPFGMNQVACSLGMEPVCR